MPDGEVPELDETQDEILNAFAYYRDAVRGGDPAAKDARLLPCDPSDPDRYLLAELPTPAPTGLPEDGGASAVAGRRSVEEPGDTPPPLPDAQQAQSASCSPAWRRLWPGLTDR